MDFTGHREPPLLPGDSLGTPKSQESLLEQTEGELQKWPGDLWAGFAYPIPIFSMYGIFTYIWVFLGAKCW
jgi:hypothetical protein